MRRPELRTPLARAVVPVLAGIGFFIVLGLFLWGIAALISGSGNQTSTLAPTTADIGNTRTYANIIAEDGPIILPDLLEASGRRTIVLDHTGDDPEVNWKIYMAYPADRDVGCKVTQIELTRTFKDCEGRSIAVEDLAQPPAGVRPIVYADGGLTLDLLPDSAEPATTVTTSSET
ncbi:MAG: hypothetical protein ABIR32_21050 [Ilumatobacteraceae bacterium]